MSFQNRVDPWGTLHKVPDRGNYMGNRGVLHNEKQEIIRTHKIKAWVTCLLAFKDRQRKVMTPNRYTELFFLDEATAFSAGHRPCAECRRKRYNEFKEAWYLGNTKKVGDQKHSAPTMDKIIHEERILKKVKVTYQTAINTLPNGVIIQLDSMAYLLWNKHLYKWSFSGYSKTNISLDSSLEVVVLTPKSYVNCFKTGFVPHIHKSIHKAG